MVTSTWSCNDRESNPGPPRCPHDCWRLVLSAATCGAISLPPRKQDQACGEFKAPARRAALLQCAPEFGAYGQPGCPSQSHDTPMNSLRPSVDGRGPKVGDAASLYVDLVGSRLPRLEGAVRDSRGIGSEAQVAWRGRVTQCGGGKQHGIGQHASRECGWVGRRWGRR